ncbi:MAG: GNAT family N-acetyltransferase [Candidatus Paceibacterota bacterium]|jgi:RimJ/RimL family protein N-acetyltransferase
MDKKNNQNQPRFKDGTVVEISNHLTCQKFFLQRIDNSFNLSSEAVNEIAAVCSQRELYDFLFKETFNGRPYTIHDAIKFLDWAKKGWEEKTYFIFLVKDLSGKIVGAVDIKSANLEGAEIGYWADRNVRGFMTNAITALCNIARNAGYKSLYGLVIPENSKSIGVLERAGFKKKKEPFLEKGKHYIKYEIIFKQAES